MGLSSFKTTKELPDRELNPGPKPAFQQQSVFVACSVSERLIGLLYFLQRDDAEKWS
ncbi:hypothetical protein PROFUN_07734 [Planoprotostelium fungivorum]|uniref:Uncharacterized protein n=1 Tax=Planoprotostelium fungivorum TaxID=1890364 RepID=A0A2P6N1E4_9EUKA|nr:hypothetical protein PROFUN_07734 [Planoprotostelium fungivorum]